jgi:CSLREA domain-containing protein
MMRRWIAALPLLLVYAGGARALITVDTLADPLSPPAGSCTLRYAITAVNTAAAQGGCPAGVAGDTVNFSVNGTISLAASLPPITASMTILGPNAPFLTIDGDNRYSLFVITADNITFNLYALTVTGGRGPANGGGAVALGGAGPIPATFLHVSGVQFTANGARFGGAIDVDGGADVLIANSTFEGNLTSNFGGAIDLFNGSLLAVNATFYGNVAASSSGGGAIYLGTNGTATLRNCTLAGNQAPSGAAGGGGLKVHNGSLTISNTIIAGNSSALDVDISGAITSLGYNLVQSRGGSAGWIASDLADGSNPLLGPIGIYLPGSTRMMSISPASPAYNAIPGCNGAPTTDQRDIARPQGPNCDIGSYEWIATPQEVSAFTANALRASKGVTPGLVVLNFEDQPGMTGYNVYQGNLPAAPSGYTHAANPGNVCNVATTAAAGRRTTPAAGLGTAGNHYYLVTSFTASEGPSGFDSSAVEIPPGYSTCAP